MCVFLSNCSQAPAYDDPVPEHDTFKIESKQVGETRTINIWTPPEYKSGNDSLPVLYMPDGGIVEEDFPHIANTLAELVKSKKIPPVILVGIQNTKRQRDLTGPTEVEKDKEIAAEVGKSANFRAFIREELIPEINKKYRTTARKGIIGESLAGLFVMETFLLQPADFDFYISFDPSLWWNGHNYDKNVEKYLQNLPEKKTVIWFASSGEEGMSKAAHSIANALEKVSSSKVMWKYSDEPKEKHNTIFRATKEKAIIWALNAK
jgi:hypothetical protein